MTLHTVTSLPYFLWMDHIISISILILRNLQNTWVRYIPLNLSARKTQTFQRTWQSYFLLGFVDLYSVVSEEKSNMFQPTRGRDSYLEFPINQNIHNLGRGRWDLSSFQVSLKSVKRFIFTSRKYFSTSEAGLTKEDYLQIFKCVSFWLHGCCG